MKFYQSELLNWAQTYGKIFNNKPSQEGSALAALERKAKRDKMIAAVDNSYNMPPPQTKLPPLPGNLPERPGT